MSSGPSTGIIAKYPLESGTGGPKVHWERHPANYSAAHVGCCSHEAAYLCSCFLTKIASRHDLSVMPITDEQNNSSPSR